MKTQQEKNAYQRDWYERNRERQSAWVRNKTKQYIEENFKRLRSYLLDHSCVDCGESDLVVLEFDHVRGEKKKEVTRMIWENYGWLEIQKEIEKCDVRCANCHKRRTHKNSWRCTLA